MINLDALNPPQREAVLNYEGPVLVLAGAGSGKTRVITFRIAYLLEEKLAKPSEIMAVTFTNKAASEMRQRVLRMLQLDNIAAIFIGTFHAFGARFLRRHADHFGRTPRFTIYDRDDQDRLLKVVLTQLVGKEQVRAYLPSTRLIIEKVKNSLEAPKECGILTEHPQQSLFLDIYQRYNDSLKQNNAFDFDDLITLPCQLLRQDEKWRESYRQRFRFILIDEFQDTNFAQGELARLLAAPDGNITAVGDDDQSIYGWRGALLGNILQFSEDYKNVKTFRLEQNYRSTKAILQVAYQVIKNNRSRHAKKLWTNRTGGVKPRLLSANDEREEAEWVVDRIKELISDKAYHPGNIAILYRTNAQSRAFEDVLRREIIPYIIIGGLRFYERKEVKDFLAYLRLLVNPSDLISLQRIINLPPRGIGAKTFQKLHSYAARQKVPLFDAVLRADQIEDLSSTSAQRVMKFSEWVVNLRAAAAEKSLFEVGERLLQESELLPYYRKSEGSDAAERENNLSELLNALHEYCFESHRPAIEDLEDFLQEVALVTDVDQYHQDEKSITLMTLHAAKGLEFPVVFMTGLEDGLFPLQNAIAETENLEEERRLFYVGATRAEDLLFLSYARHRRRWGQEMSWQKSSRFLDEIPAAYLEKEDSGFGFDSHLKLTPGAGSQPKKSNFHGGSGDVNQAYPLGARVKHATFGEGMIIKKEGWGENLRLMVNFEEAGMKLLLAGYAKLQVLSP